MKTSTFENQSVATPEYTEDRSDAERVFDELNAVHNFPDFMHYCSKYGIDPTRPATSEYANAYAAYVEDYVRTRTSEELMDESYASLLTIGSHFAAATYAESEVTFMKKRRDWTKEEKQYYHDTLMPQVITYNRRVVEYLYRHPEADIRELSRIMFETSKEMLADSDRDEVHDRIRALIKGCRTEAMTARLFDRIGVPYDFGTVSEDARGGDLVINMPESKILVDLKSSLDGMTGIDKEKALDAVEAGRMYLVTGKNRFKLFMKFDKGHTAELPADTSMDMAVGAQIMRACKESSNY